MKILWIIIVNKPINEIILFLSIFANLIQNVYTFKFLLMH